MKGQHAFDPHTGSNLKDERLWPDGRPVRQPVDGTGHLTNGELKSSRVALQQRFETAYQRSHAGRDVPDDLARTVGTALYQLKREDDWDCWVWFALAEHLARRGYWSTWMGSFVEPRCPRCGSRLQIERALVGYHYARCGSRCGAESNSKRSVEIVETILKLYGQAFEEISRLQAFDPSRSR
jgi:hypothetical protein